MADDDRSRAATHPGPDGDELQIDLERIKPGRSAGPNSEPSHRNGRFYRPELYSPGDKIKSKVGTEVIVIAGLALLTGILLAVAASVGTIF